MIARIGAHVTADPGPWEFPNQIKQLTDMGANTCRVQMFWGGVRQFDDSQVDQLFAATTGPEFIFMSSELVYVSGGTGDSNGIESQWNIVKWFARRYPDRHIHFELGNEPNEAAGRPITVEGRWAESPEDANRRLMQAYNYCAGSKPSNVWLMVNNVSQNDDGAFFNRFNLDLGYGSPIHNVQIVTLHAYVGGYQPLCLYGPDDPLKILRWVRSWNTSVPVKVTEAGINIDDHNWRPYRYVEFAEKLQRWSDELGGQPGAWCDSVCFYFVGWDSVVPQYRLNENDTAVIRPRLASNDCG